MSPSLGPTQEQIAALAARPADAGATPGVVIGDGEKPWWDAIIVVEYPSPAAFLDMVTNEEYQKVHEHRVAGLDRGDLISTAVWTLAE